MRTRKLGPFQVSEIGLGCMSLSPESLQAVEAAVNAETVAGLPFKA